MVARIEVGIREGLPDAPGDAVKRRIQRDLGLELDSLKVVSVYTIAAPLEMAQLERVQKELLTDPVAQISALGRPLVLDADWVIEVGYLPGVTDNPGRTTREAVAELLALAPSENQMVYTSRQYVLKGSLDSNKARAVSELLHNPLVERALVLDREAFARQGGEGLGLPVVELPPPPRSMPVDLEVSDEELALLGKAGVVEQDGQGRAVRRGPLALDLDALKAIRAYFRDQGRSPTDVELESLAQTWSEHCKHTIFASPLLVKEPGLKPREVASLMKSYIKAATKAVRESRGEDDWCLSVFHDNSGVVGFDEQWNLCYKVETHNSPSALEPYGGAITGIVGVNRDPLGTGQGALLTTNIYGFCFGDPFYQEELPYRRPGKSDPILHPRTVFEGVRRGVEDGGNKSGIPTAWGFLLFDDRYMGKPLVFVGTLGLMPREIGGKPSHLKKAEPGDRIIMAGGRIGKDGVHGATFSSEGLHAGSPMGAVQIGDPITQKKLADAQLEARDKELYNSVTDNGAGGISCSVAEMALECGGCEVDLDRLPLKYPGLQPYEMWISESQERMTYSVSPEKVEELLEVMARHGAEATVIGTFTDSGRCVVRSGGDVVMDMTLDFLHDGRPVKELEARWSPPEVAEPELDASAELADSLVSLVGRPNLCSKEFVVRQFDHEVQGGSVIKPLVGRGLDIHSEAVVMRPVLDSFQGVALSSGILPRYGDIDPYWMAACAIDAVIRNVVALGADPDRIALLDNFCWCSSDEPERLGQLERAGRACHDMAVAFKTPFISGKDSMFNDFKGFDGADNPVKISVPPTLLISSMAVVPDVRRSVTLDVKAEGDSLYALGLTRDECGAGEYYAMKGLLGAQVPHVDPEANMEIYRSLARVMEQGLLSACCPVGPGGMGFALARMAMAGRLGLEVNLAMLPRIGDMPLDHLLFSESTGRFLLCLSPEQEAGLASAMEGLPLKRIGKVAGDRLSLNLGTENRASLGVEQLVSAYKGLFGSW